MQELLDKLSTLALELKQRVTLPTLKEFALLLVSISNEWRETDEYAVSKKLEYDRAYGEMLEERLPKLKAVNKTKAYVELQLHALKTEHKQAETKADKLKTLYRAYADFMRICKLEVSNDTDAEVLSNSFADD